MIRHSLAAFINASEIASNLGINAYVQTPDLVLSDVPIPRAVISYLHEGRQEPWVIGDALRKQNPVLQVMFSLLRPQDVVDVRARFKLLIEAAKALDVGGLTHPGINFLPTCDLLRDSGDHKLFYSDQPGWFSSPTAIVYKEDSNGIPQVVSSGYTLDLVNGTVNFSVSQGAGAKIRATYKCGVVDFIIGGIAEPQVVDQENNPSKYNVVFDLVAFLLVKSTANRYL